MKTYAHAYFLLLVAYALLLEVFLYRDFKVIDQDDASAAVQKNNALFLALFGSDLDK